MTRERRRKKGRDEGKEIEIYRKRKGGEESDKRVCVERKRVKRVNYART